MGSEKKIWGCEAISLYVSLVVGSEVDGGLSNSTHFVKDEKASRWGYGMTYIFRSLSDTRDNPSVSAVNGSEPSDSYPTLTKREEE